MLVGMDVEDEEVAPQQESFMDDLNRNCTLSTKQVTLIGPFHFLFNPNFFTYGEHTLYLS